MNEFLRNLIATNEARMAEINSSIEKAETVEEVRSLGAEKERVQSAINEARNQLTSLEAQNGLNPLDTFGQRGAEPAKNVDKCDTAEYREAFMNFVCRGTAIPMELRATTNTGDASATIPTTLINEIVQNLEAYGEIYSRVRHLNVQGGVQIPVLSLKPTATWISANTGTSESDANKLDAKTSVVFNYYGLECKISQTLLANVTTIDAFQALFVPLATEAIIKALEIAIVKGSGTGEALGITVDTRVPSKNVVTLTAEEFGAWDGWKKKVFGKMKKAYRNGCFIMAQGTFDGYIDGMVDGNGQPIARVNYGIADGETYRFGGKEVLTVEDDIITAYEDASTGDVVGVFVNLKDYAVNSNMEFKVVKWEDHDTNEVKNKTIVICDGKLVDPNGVIVIKKG